MGAVGVHSPVTIETPMRLIYVQDISVVGNETVRVVPREGKETTEIAIAHVVSVTYRKGD